MASVFLSAISGRIKLPHSAFNRSSSDGPFHVQHSTFQQSTFNIPHSTFHIPHYKLFLSARVRAAFTIRHLLRWLLSRQPPPFVVFADPKGAHPRSPNCRRAKVFPLLISLFCNRNVNNNRKRCVFNLKAVSLQSIGPHSAWSWTKRIGEREPHTGFS